MNILQLGALLQSRELTLQFLREKGLLYDAIFCSSCNRWMRHQRDASVKCDGYIFRCVTCRDKASIRRDSFFAAQRKDFSDYLTALYFFAKSIPACSAEKMMQGMMSQSTIFFLMPLWYQDSSISSTTFSRISTWYPYCIKRFKFRIFFCS